MKRSLAVLNLIVMLGGIGMSVSHAAKTEVPSSIVRALQTIRENANAARENAAIYQWQRVNREVDRIAADERKVEKALASDTAHSRQAAALQQAVRELRSARLAHDAGRIQAAAEQTTTLIGDLLQK